jgi:ribosome-binding protein aMBF1 (putative translation factor)
MPDKLYKPPYAFSTTIGECLTRKMMSFYELAEKLKMPVEDLMRQANGHSPPSKALVKGLAKELGIDEKLLEKLAEAVRQDLALSRP